MTVRLFHMLTLMTFKYRGIGVYKYLNMQKELNKEQVRRNIERFPEDFIFELTKEENLSLRSHNVTLKIGRQTKGHKSFAVLSLKSEITNCYFKRKWPVINFGK